MKKTLELGIVIGLILQTICSVRADITVKIADCDVNSNGIDPIDLLSAIALSPAEEYSVFGKSVYKVSQEMPPFVASTRHGFVDSQISNSEPTEPEISIQTARFKDVAVNEIAILWIRQVGDVINNIFITFTYSEQERWTEEELKSALLHPLERLDANQDGKADKWDVAIISKLLPLPRGTETDWDPQIEYVNEILSTNPRYLNPNVRLAATINAKRNLATAWGDIKRE